MLDRICQYSTIIFAGNVAVLIVVAIATDYWEYRGFKLKKIRSALGAWKPIRHKSSVEIPNDTDNYVTIKYTWNDTKLERALDEEDVYESPLLLKRFYTVNYPARSASKLPKHRLHENHGVIIEDKLILFYQYGNLFRDCDRLEDLERISFFFALISIVSSTVSVIAGGYGSLTQDKMGMLTASSSALVSGISLTITIALFHGKCHLLHRRQFLRGRSTPFGKFVEGQRNNYFGWSFALAWICVVLCFIHTWVWLLKAQDMPPVGERLRRRRSAKVARHRNSSVRNQEHSNMLNSKA